MINNPNEKEEEKEKKKTNNKKVGVKEHFVLGSTPRMAGSAHWRKNDRRLK